jgi:hypothetical protein
MGRYRRPNLNRHAQHWQHHCAPMNLYRSPQRDLHWSHLRTTSTSVRSSSDAQSKWSEAQRVGLNQEEALLTACPEGPSRAASFRFITTPATPRTSLRTPSRVYASCGTETARACARCVIGLDGRWSRPIPQRGRLNAADRCADATLLRFEMEPHCGRIGWSDAKVLERLGRLS